MDFHPGCFGAHFEEVATMSCSDKVFRHFLSKRRRSDHRSQSAALPAAGSCLIIVPVWYRRQQPVFRYGPSREHVMQTSSMNWTGAATDGSVIRISFKDQTDGRFVTTAIHGDVVTDVVIQRVGSADACELVRRWSEGRSFVVPRGQQAQLAQRQTLGQVYPSVALFDRLPCRTKHTAFKSSFNR